MANPTPAEIEQRWSDALELARLHDVQCTGGPSWLPSGTYECPGAGAVPIFAYGHLWAVGCRYHTGMLLDWLFHAGVAAVETIPLVDFINSPKKDAFLKQAFSIREANLVHGAQIPK